MATTKTAAKQPSLIPKGLASQLQPLAVEIDRLHESAVWSAQGQFEQAKLWRAMNALLGIPAATLAAVAGGTSLAATKATNAPGILALLAAGFGAALTTLNPSRRVAQAQAAANAYLSLQTDARQLLTIDLAGLGADDARQQLQEITSRRDEVNRTAEPPSWYAHWRARRNIKGGRQAYDADAAHD